MSDLTMSVDVSRFQIDWTGLDRGLDQSQQSYESTWERDCSQYHRQRYCRHLEWPQQVSLSLSF